MSEKKIANYLFQVLEALIFLRKHSFQCGHITSQNILINSGTVLFVTNSFLSIIFLTHILSYFSPLQSFSLLLSSLTDYWNSLMGFIPRPALLHNAYDARRGVSIPTDAGEEDARSSSPDEEKKLEIASSNLGQIDPDLLSLAYVAFELATVCLLFYITSLILF